jgi:hypothetical protein
MIATCMVVADPLAEQRPGGWRPNWSMPGAHSHAGYLMVFRIDKTARIASCS